MTVPLNLRCLILGQGEINCFFTHAHSLKEPCMPHRATWQFHLGTEQLGVVGTRLCSIKRLRCPGTHGRTWLDWLNDWMKDWLNELKLDWMILWAMTGAWDTLVLRRLMEFILVPLIRKAYLSKGPYSTNRGGELVATPSEALLTSPKVKDSSGVWALLLCLYTTPIT